MRRIYVDSSCIYSFLVFYLFDIFKDVFLVLGGCCLFLFECLLKFYILVNNWFSFVL